MIERVKRHQKSQTASDRGSADISRSPLSQIDSASPAASFGTPAATTATSDTGVATMADPALGHEFDQVRVNDDAPSPERANEGEQAQVDEAEGLVAGARADAAKTDADAGDDSDDDDDDDGQNVIINDQEVALPGQMRKSAFLEQLRTSVQAAVAHGGPEALEQATVRFERGLKYYTAREASELQTDIRREVAEAAHAAVAGDYISAVVGRVERAAERAERAERAEQAKGRGSGRGEPAETAASSSATSSKPPSWLSFEPSRGESPLAELRLLGKGRGGRLVQAEDPLVIQEQLGDGMPLAEGLRPRMETAFAQSFSGVRVHTDSTAASLAREIDSRAFSVGNHVAFAAGEYRPGSLVGDALIAHELAHVMQQGAGVAASGMQAEAEPESAALEEDADLSATGAMASLYLGTRGSLAELGRSAAPRFKSGLGLRRCGPSATADASAPTVFPGYSEIVGDSTMKAKFDAVWTSTKNDCTETPNQRREKAFWIQWNKDTSKFSATSTVNGDWVGPTEGASVNPYPIAPDADPVFTVGSFHTHTSTQFRSKSTCRGVGPSDADVSSDNSDDTAGVVYDYVGSGGNVCGGESKDAAAKLYHSGPNRRTKQ